MRVNLVHNARFPVEGYGGTERVFWWLAKGLRELGHEVVVAARPGSECPYASRVVPVDFSREVPDQLPQADVSHYFFPLSKAPSSPYLVTIHGNGKPGESFLENSVFVSANHASRHGSQAFVHNGIDPDEYSYSEKKDETLVFCAKASWKVKNVDGAVGIAKQSKRTIRIIGGTRPFWKLPSRYVHWEGIIGGTRKAKILAESRALLFPVRWHEPFGIAVVEALVSGTPVLATPFGSLPELVGKEVGRLCSSYEEFAQGVSSAGDFKPSVCRDWAVEKFHYRSMTSRYLGFYEKVGSGRKVSAQCPRVIPSRESSLLPIPRRIA